MRFVRLLALALQAFGSLPIVIWRFGAQTATFRCALPSPLLRSPLQNHATSPSTGQAARDQVFAPNDRATPASAGNAAAPVPPFPEMAECTSIQQARAGAARRASQPTPQALLPPPRSLFPPRPCSLQSARVICRRGRPRPWPDPISARAHNHPRNQRNERALPPSLPYSSAGVPPGAMSLPIRLSRSAFLPIPARGFRQSAARLHHTPRESRSRSEEHTSELQSQFHLVCRLLLEKKKKNEDPSVLPLKNRCNRRIG